MIHAMIDTERLYLHVYGHAGYAEAGRDIVCAGVSALSQALADYSLANNGCAHKLEDDGGDPVLTVGMDPRDGRADMWRAAFEVVRHGLSMIADRYPDHLELEGGLQYVGTMR